MHAWFAGLIFGNVILFRRCQLGVELESISLYALQLLIPSPSLVCGCEAVLEQQRLWLQQDKRPLTSLEVRVSCGLAGEDLYRAHRLVLSAVLVFSKSKSCVPELPKGLLGGGG